MATKFYFHDALTGDTGTLPTTSQSARGTPGLTSDATTVNRSMNTSIGVLQASKAITASGVGAKKEYFTRFCSTPLAAQTIAAATWNLSFAAKTTVVGNQAFFTATWVSPCLYVWRPGTGAIVGTIIDAAGTGFAGSQGANAEISTTGTFSGSAVTTQAGDILCFEVYLSYTSTSTSTTVTFFYDGTTEDTTNGDTVSSQASYVNCPNTITFSGAVAAVVYPNFFSNIPNEKLTMPRFYPNPSNNPPMFVTPLERYRTLLRTINKRRIPYYNNVQKNLLGNNTGNGLRSCNSKYSYPCERNM